MRNPFAPLFTVGRNRGSSVEAILDIFVNGHPVRITGSAVESMARQFNKLDGAVAALNLKGTGGHYIAKDFKKLASLTKTNLNAIQNYLSYIEQPVEYLFLNTEEIHQLITEVASCLDFQEAHAAAMTENNIRAVGDIAYKEGMLMRSMGMFSYSTNADPNIRRLRTEQAYRQMYNETKKRP